MKVTDCRVVPTGGTVVGVVKAKRPETAPRPLLNVELARVCPEVMALAVGQRMILGTVLTGVEETATLTVPDAVL